MYSLIKRLNIDVIRLINKYNNYTQLDLEYFKFLHKGKLDDVLTELDHFFLRPKLVNLLTLNLSAYSNTYATTITLYR